MGSDSSEQPQIAMQVQYILKDVKPRPNALMQGAANWRAAINPRCSGGRADRIPPAFMVASLGGSIHSYRSNVASCVRFVTWSFLKIE